MKPYAETLVVVLVGVLVLTSFALAQERRTRMKHPVLGHSIDPKKAAEYERAVARVLAMSEDEMLSFVPPWAYVAYCECPNCYGGVEGNGVLVWSIERPEQLKCRFCGTVVHPNEKYPEDRVLTGRNKLGEEIRFPYYYNEEKKVPHFLSTHLCRLKRSWLTGQCEALGRAYLATGKEDYARRVALALDRMAQRYPHYPVMQNLPRRFTFRESQDPPYLWDSGKWGYFHNEIPIEVIPPYDMVYDSPAFDELSRQRGYNVRERIEKDFLKAAFAAAEVSKYHVSNVVGYDVRSAAMLGWVITEPRYVHWAFARIKENLDVGFFRDGMWHEAPSYHYMTIGGLKRCFEAIPGYSDPPGYVDAVDGTRFDNLEPEKQLPFSARAERAPEVIGFPNGISCPLHDTHPGEKRATPRRQTVSTLAPAYGHASLGRGSRPHQMLAQLYFSGDYGHHHSDNLNLTLWAKEREMLPDLGYTWTQMRYWTTCTLGHNLVVVDCKDQSV